MAADISFEFTGLGWVKIRLAVDGKTYDSPSVSYCTDAFGDLARMALCVAAGAGRSEASFELEPGELRLVLTRALANDAVCHLTVLEFADAHPPQPDSQGLLCFEAHVQGTTFGRAMLVALDSIWSTYGQDQFNAHWAGERGFPRIAAEALRRALEVTDPRPADPAFESIWASLINEAPEN